MALDEPKKEDEVFDEKGTKFIIDKDLLNQAKPINVDFIELEVTDKYVFWGGTINGVLQFVYKVTPDENTNGVEFNPLEGYNEDDKKNEEIMKTVESYFDKFYEYWIDSVIQKPAEQQ